MINKQENTEKLLKIARHFRIKRIGIGRWDKEFRKSKSYFDAFGYTQERMEDSIYSDSEWDGWPVIWKVADEAHYEFNIHSGCGNEGQHQLDTRIFELGIYSWNKDSKKWDKVK